MMGTVRVGPPKAPLGHSAAPERELAEEYRVAFNHAPTGQALIGLDGRYLQVNRAMCEFLGYSEAQLRGTSVTEVIHPDDLVDDGDAGVRLMTGEVAVHFHEHRYLTATGGMSWGATSVSLARREDGSPHVYISHVKDINERKAHEKELSEERRRLRDAQSIGRLGSWEKDLISGIITWSDTLFELYGLDRAESVEDYDASLVHVHPDDADQLHAALEDCGNNGTALRNRHRIYRANDGELRWFEVRGARLHDGTSSRIVGASVDVTEQILAEARLEHAALHDTLTGLPNRRLVVDRLGRALDRSEREGEVVVLFCDLDGFKRVNDVHGHQAGDAVLVETARKLSMAIRSGDTIGRMGGDEFVIICSVARGDDATELAGLVAERIEGAMAEPILVDGVEHVVTVSAGICLADQGDSADLVLRNADVAMYLAKAQGKNGHAMFDASLASAVIDRDSIERRIRSALDDNTLEVFYQPIVDPITGVVRSVEALMRVPDGVGGYLDTFQAVGVAEQAGTIPAIGERVLQMACSQVAQWRQQSGHADLAVCVNRSAAEIARPGLYSRISEAVIASGLDPKALTIEITETVLLDAAPNTILDLERLRADGIGIAIDDFGTGYASLRYLATLPITCLKVDRSFTAGLPGDSVSSTILLATIGLAADLDIGCVVEGVETMTQLNALPQSPRLLVQGYLFAGPQSATTELPALLTPRSA